MSSEVPDLAGLNFKEDSWLSQAAGMKALNVTENDAGATAPRIELGETDRIFVTAKVPVSDIEVVSDLTERGFAIVDTALSFHWTPTGDASLPDGENTPLASSGLIVRAAEKSDADSVGLLAGRAFTGSRFHLDPDFLEEKARVIKCDWARNLVLGRRGDQCIVATCNGRVIGFLGILKQDNDVPAYVIDLIAVDPDFQRGGVGMSLVISLLNNATRVGRNVIVGTQAANVASVRFYEALGFRYAGACYVLHAHYRGERSV